jgi:hypothetical protein
MKIKILILIFIAIFAFGKSWAVFSRDTIPAGKENVLPAYTGLLKKSNRQQTAGWVLFGTGGALGIIGASIAWYEIMTLFTPDAKDHSNTADVLMYGGLGLMLLSIPFIVSGYKNRRKAKLFMKQESLRFNTGFQAIHPLTSIGIKLNF